MNSKREEFNKVYSNVAMLYTESARHNYDEEMLSNYLKSLEAQGARVDLACKTYSKYKGWLERRLSQIGNQLPHITDVHWRLDYCTKVYFIYLLNLVRNYHELTIGASRR